MSVCCAEACLYETFGLCVTEIFLIKQPEGQLVYLSPWDLKDKPALCLRQFDVSDRGQDRPVGPKSLLHHSNTVKRLQWNQFIYLHNFIWKLKPLRRPFLWLSNLKLCNTSTPCMWRAEMEVFPNSSTQWMCGRRLKVKEGKQNKVKWHRVTQKYNKMYGAEHIMKIQIKKEVKSMQSWVNHTWISTFTNVETSVAG